MAKKSAPWKRDNPRKKAGRKSKKMSSKQKSSAKASARRAGRPYPNLVDNMRAASKKKSAKKSGRKKTGRKRAATKKSAAKKSTRKKSSKKKKARKRVGSSVTKDPKGGLTAAGRRAFAKRDGSHLKPGVTKTESEMSPADMRRKGSWAVRFYGRKSLPPLVDDNGKPTRHALSAHAWGEPVPRTKSAARRIAAKGRHLLKRYEASKRKKA